MGLGPIITGSACALACVQAVFLGLTASRDAPGGEACPHGWVQVALLLLMPACVHLFSLDIVGADILRQWLRANAWYAYRRPLQFFALAALCVVAVIWGLNACRQLMRKGCLWTWVCLLLSLLLCFSAMVRLVSWHDSDAIMNWSVGGMTAGRWLELTALAVILFVINSRLLSRWSWS